MNRARAWSETRSILRRTPRWARRTETRRSRDKRPARPLLFELEQRQLLSLAGFNPTLAVDLPIDPTVQRAAQISAVGQHALFRVTVDQPGLLSASDQGLGFQTTLSLLTEQGSVLIQSQAASAANSNPLIDQHLIPGTYYLDVLARTGVGTFVLSTSYTPSVAPLQPIPTGDGTGPYSIVHEDFNEDGIQDLALVDEYSNDVLVEMGNGDGTFGSQSQWTVGSGPVAIAAVDLTGNGIEDLVTVNSYSNDVSILMGRGGGTFAPEQRIAVGNGPSALAVADLNGDGIPDLAVVNQLDNNVSILLGKRDGTFRHGGLVAVGADPTAIAAGDFNGDDKMDLVVGNDMDMVVGKHLSKSFSVLLGNGDGTFQPQRTVPISGGVSSIVTGVFTGNGRTDVALADNALNVVSVFLGNGDGTFQSGQDYPVGKMPECLIAGDFTGNGLLDLATANYSSGSASLLVGNGDGTFQLDKELAAGSGPMGLTAVDMTGDGRLGLAVVNFVGQNISILMGNGDGTFLTSSSSLPPISPSSIVVGDVNGDGIPDLVMSDDTASDVRVFLGRPDGTFQDPLSFAAGAGAYDLVLADFNGDHKLDIAAVNTTSNDVSVFLGRGDGTFETQVRYAVGLQPSYVTAADLNHDGFVDIVTANWQSNDVSVLMGSCNGKFKPAVTYAMGDAPSGIIAVDVNGDGIPDLITPNQFSNDISVRLGKGDGTFGAETRFEAGDGPFYAVAGDFNGDGRPDIAVSDYASGPPSIVAILFNNGDGTFQPPRCTSVGDNPYRLATADLDHDGLLDLVVTNDGSNDLSVLLGKGDGTFQPEQRYPTGAGGYGLAIADLNGDGRLDLVTANYRSDDITVYHGDGDGTFEQMPTIDARSSQLSMATGEFNGDGFMDLADVDPSSNVVRIWLSNSGTSFRDAYSYPVGDQPDKVLAVDVNGDGRLDLIVTNRGSNDVSVRLGNGDGTFQPQQRYAVGSLPGPLVIDDFNGDSWLDVAVADTGSGEVSILFNKGNGEFAPERRFSVGVEPVDLIADDLGRNHHPDLITANRSSGDVSVLANDGRGNFIETRLRQPGWTPAQLSAQSDVPGTPPSFVFADPVLGTVTIVMDPLGTPTYLSLPSPVVGGLAVAVGDFNNDGEQDDAVIKLESNPEVQAWECRLRVALIAPGGQSVNFVAPVNIPFRVAGMTAGDFNHDGNLDLAIANADSGQIEIRLGVGDGSFQEPQAVFSVVSNTIITGDIMRNGSLAALVLNGKGQLVYRQEDADAPGQFGTPYLVNPDPANLIKDVAVIRSRSGIRAAVLTQFVPDPNFPNRSIPVLAIEQSDLVAGYQTQKVILLDPRLISRDPSWLASHPTLLASRVLTGDLDGDSRDDIVVLCRGTNQVLVYYQDASGSYPDVPSRVIDLGFAPADATLADLYGTGYQDIVVADQYSGVVAIVPTLPIRAIGPTILLAGGLGTADLQIVNGQLVRHTWDQTSSILVGRFFSADHTDIAVVDHGTDRISILRQLPGGGFANPEIATTFQTGQGPIKAVAGDFDGDGQLELAILNQDGQDVTILRHDKSGGFQVSQQIDVGQRPTGIRAQDLTGSGKDDLLVANEAGDLLVLMNKGDGTFSPYQRGTQGVTIAVLTDTGQYVLTDQAQDQLSVQSLTGSSSFVQGRANGLLAPSDVKIADLNGHRDANGNEIEDLVVANSGANNILIYIGNGDGTFAPPQKFFAGTDPVAITVGDVNGDGLPDLIVTNSGSNDVSVFLSAVEGSSWTSWTLVTGPRLSVGVDPVSTTLADVTGDGIPDLLVVNQGSNNVEILPGLGGGFFDDRVPTADDPLHTTFAAGNSPIRAFVGKFDSGPGLDLVIVNTQSNDLTYYCNFMAASAQSVTIPSGGLSPIAALQDDFNRDGYADLIVANNGDGTIALFEGGPSGLVLTNSVTLPGSTHPTDIVIEGGTSGQLRLFVAAQGQSNLIPISISFLPTLSTIVPTGSSAGSTFLSDRGQTAGPSGGFGTSSLELASSAGSEASSSVFAASATSGASGLSVTTTGIGMASVMQSLTSLTGGSFSSLVSMLLEVDPTHVTEVQPLRNGEFAAVAVMLTVQEFRVDRLDEQLRSDLEKDQEDGPPVMPSLELRSRDRVDTRLLLIERFVSGIEDELGTVIPAQDTGPIVPGAAWDGGRGIPGNSGPVGDETQLPVDSTVSAAGTELLHTPSRPAEALDHEAMMMSPTTNSAALTYDTLPDLDPGSATHESCQVLCLTFSIAAGVIAASAGRRPIARKVRKLAPQIGGS